MSRHRAAILLDELRTFCQEAAAVVAGQDVDDHLDNWRDRRALERIIFLIGEAAVQLEKIRPELDLPWNDLRGIRNLLAHQYGRVDPEILFVEATKTVPELMDALTGIKGD